MMAERDQSRWLIVGVLFVSLFLIWGPVNAGGVFFLPVVKSFGWSRAQFALLGGLAAIAAGASGPFIGWLIDRAGVRIMMISGAAAIVLCNLALSRATSLGQFAAIFIVVGVAITATTIIPCSIVIANWFSSERGLAMGIAFAGIPLGGTGITILANYVVGHYGWRIGYLVMGLPVAAIVIPALVVYLRTRPPATAEVAAAIAAGTEAAGDRAARPRAEGCAAVAFVLDDRGGATDVQYGVDRSRRALYPIPDRRGLYVH